MVAWNASRSAIHTKTWMRFWMARWMSGWSSVSTFGSSMWGVMNSTARLTPERVPCDAAVSNAMDSDCRFGVVAWKSGWNEFKLTSQSLTFACVMIGPASVTRLRSSCRLAAPAFAHVFNAWVIQSKREAPVESRNPSAGPGLTATTICVGMVNSFKAVT